jgi:hypothetical protein
VTGTQKVDRASAARQGHDEPHGLKHIADLPAIIRVALGDSGGVDVIVIFRVSVHEERVRVPAVGRQQI